MNLFQIKSQDLWLSVYVQPGAKSTQWAGLYGDSIKVRLSASPVEGKANEALCQFLARAFSCAPRDVAVLRGQTSRQKIVCFRGCADQYSSLQQQLQAYLLAP